MKLVKSPLGFLEASPKPSTDDLRKFYSSDYFSKGQYAYEYTKEELLHKTINCHEALYFSNVKAAGRLLDLGCGEGFFLTYFAALGWDVTGADFTTSGVEKHNQEYVDKVMIGDIDDTINRLIAAGEYYDLIVCNNLLEHLIEPLDFLARVKKLMAKSGVLRLYVPNDDSIIQRELIKRGAATAEFWMRAPEHLSYFNTENFSTILDAAEFRVKALLSDFPIYAFPFNEDSNYLKWPDKGRNCHFARVAIENMIYSKSIEALVSFRRGCADAGVGRCISAYCEVK